MELPQSEEQRILIKTPTKIIRKMMGSKLYKQMRDKKDEQAETTEKQTETHDS